MDKDLLAFLQELLNLTEEALPSRCAPCGGEFCNLVTGCGNPGNCSDGNECRYRYQLQGRLERMRGYLESKRPRPEDDGRVVTAGEMREEADWLFSCDCSECPFEPQRNDEECGIPIRFDNKERLPCYVTSEMLDWKATVSR